MTSDEVAIDWLDGNGWHELSDREQALLAKVREAYQRGFHDGEAHGAQQALKASTQLTTALVSRPTQRAIAVLERLLGLVAEAEDERTSHYWRDDP